MDEEYLHELFAPFGDVVIKKMFGGVGIFHRGLNFAGIMDDALRLKADETTISDFEAESSEPWTYKRKDGKVTVMGYWSVPERLMEDPDEFAKWARDAFEVAVRADAKKPASKQKLQDAL